MLTIVRKRLEAFDPDKYVWVGRELVRRVQGAALLQQIGPRGYANAFAAAAPSWTPPYDRAWIVRRIVINNLSANDNWQVLVAGREIMRFRMLTTGNQRQLFIPTAGTAFNPPFFDWVRNALGIDPSIAVPVGMPIQVQSVGGATADVELEYREVTPDEAANWPINNYLKNVFFLPIIHYLAAAQSAAGAVQFDTQVAPPWIPAIHNGAAIPVNWKFELLALFHEGMGVNTFSGSANHQSTTQDVHYIKDSVQLFSRVGVSPAQTALHGPPDFGSAAAAGSANTVFGQRSAVFPPFQLANDKPDSTFDTPLVLLGGNTLQMLLDIQGDLTGSASYANDLHMWFARVTTPAGMDGQL